MAITNNLTEFADNETAQYFTPEQLSEPTNITHVGAVLNNRLNYKSYNSLAKMTSKVVVALGDFIVNYSGITTGTIDINTTVAQWGNFLASIMTDWKLANSVNATTPLNISGTTENSKTTNGHTHAITTGTIGNGSTDIVNGGAVYNYANPYFTNTRNIMNADLGFSAGYGSTAERGGAVGGGASTISGGAVGSGASATGGGAVGNGASATNGGAIGSGASETDGGGAIGSGASATTGGAVGRFTSSTGGGGAVGDTASATTGGAVGYNASATTGFAGGYLAKATGNYSVQLGEGTNADNGTIQYRDSKVFNTDLTKLAPSFANGWTEITSLAGTPLNLTGKYTFYLTTANGTTVGTYYDTTMNLGTTNTLSFGYNGGFVRVYVSTTGAISGAVIPDSGSTATLTSINLWYKKMW